MRALAQAALGTISGSGPHRALLLQDIQRFNTRALAAPFATAPTAPPGAPIGDPGMNHLWRMVEPACSQDETVLRHEH